jgi:deoxyribodipyrimidine photo-lyase
MSECRPTLLWLRRELRLHDNAALVAALQSGGPVIPIFVLDDEAPGAWKPGGAQRWWLHHSLASLAADLRAKGANLVLRRGRIAEVLPALVRQTGAAEVHAGQPTEPWARDAMAALGRTLGARLHLHRTVTLFGPEEIRTGAGGPYHVFTPFARACRARGLPPSPLPAPAHIPTPAALPRLDRLDDWRLLPTHPDWADGLGETWAPGERGARARLHHFTATILARYDRTRDTPGVDGTAMLSPHLHWGEISPGEAWHAAIGADDGAGAEAWTSELLWREFSACLLWHHPDLPEVPLRREFADMPWRRDEAALRAWQRGRTGLPIVDAGMRQLRRTGWMHNRVRMIVASFLVKHLLLPWQTGEAWFWDTLVDADLASNAAQWQWVAGSGADAAPYFRIFNPVLQGEKFDPDGTYVRRFVPELAHLRGKAIHAPWQYGGAAGYPAPVIDPGEGRRRALAALQAVTEARA